jgi:hypothetical protein
MKPHEEEIRRLVTEWIWKADPDFNTVVRLSAEEPFRDIVAFHTEQTAGRLVSTRASRVEPPEAPR